MSPDRLIMWESPVPCGDGQGGSHSNCSTPTPSLMATVSNASAITSVLPGPNSNAMFSFVEYK